MQKIMAAFISPLCVVAFAVIAIVGIPFTTPAIADGAGCAAETKRASLRSTGDGGRQSIKVTMKTRWLICDTHAHARWNQMSIGDAEQIEEAHLLERVSFTCVVRNDEYEDRLLQWSGSVTRDKPSNRKSVYKWRSRTYQYPTHPRTECRGTVQWNQGPDRSFDMKRGAL